MKKLLLLGGIGLLIALIIGFWVYSFLYGSPTNTPGGMFTNLGIFNNNTPIAVPTPEATTTPVVNVQTPDRLRQLTTKPVIGMRVITSGTSTIMRYVESGTGQVFDINLETGVENRVSQISVPMASQADISPNGMYVAVRSGYTSKNELMLITITSDKTDSKVLPNNVDDFHFSPTNELLFTEFNNGATEGKQYLPSTGLVQRIFTIPFTAVRIVWSNSTSTPHYVYTKPAENLPSYAYVIKNGTVVRLPFTGSNLTLMSDTANKEVIFSRTSSDGQTLENLSYNPQTKVISRNSLRALPEKCVTRAGRWLCANTQEPITNNSLVMWYKGEQFFDDSLWVTNSDRSVTQLVYPKSASGRSIDVLYPSVSSNGRVIYFLNKIDNTLWIYE